MNYLFVLTIHTFRYGIVCIPKANGTANQMRIIKEFLVCISFAAVFSFFVVALLPRAFDLCAHREDSRERKKNNTSTYNKTIKLIENHKPDAIS